MTKRNLKPQEPGTPKNELPADETVEDNTDATEPEATAFEETDVFKRAVAREVQRAMLAQSQAQAAQKVIEADLPDQKEVNPDKISRAVLTKDGYVCPLRDPQAIKQAERDRGMRH